MIVVLSYNDFEQGTEGVIEWLVHLKANFIKVTIKDFFLTERNFEIDIMNGVFSYSGVDITNQINVFFYRRLFAEFKIDDVIENPFKTKIEKMVTNESSTLVNYLFHLFRHKTWLPHPNRASLNKLIQIEIAKQAGLNVPKSKIINTKKNLLEFQEECESGIITKPIGGLSYFISSKFTYTTFVNKVEKEEIEKLHDSFFPSLFQEKIEKEFEIRVFYLDGEFYSFALLISNAEQMVDIKQNKEFQHMHWVNYKLPKHVENKIEIFMNTVGLNTGSLDVVKKKNGEYFFLEVNPVGQYGHPSFYGNFELERIIANWLIKKDHPNA